MYKRLVLVKGGGDLATGIAHRLFRSGFAVVITELDAPTVIRRTVAFAQAVYSGEATVEGITAVRTSLERVSSILLQKKIPLVVEPFPLCLRKLRPWALVDATITKKNTGTDRSQADLVIGVGPGFRAAYDVHAVIETMRGHDLGRVILQGEALPNTGIPGEIGGYTLERLLRAPGVGTFTAVSRIGDTVNAGDTVAMVDNIPVVASIRGIVRGMLQDGLQVVAGMKIGDIDPRCQRQHCFTISDKARAIGGGVLEAVLWMGGENTEKYFSETVGSYGR